jgi:hypothetical protein
VTPGKTKYGLGIKRASKKEILFDPRKDNNTFEEERREFVGEHAFSSKAQSEVMECEMPPTFDQSAPPRQGKEVSKLVDFLYTCIDLIKDEELCRNYNT